MNSDTECEITLPRNGDLIQDMYIKLETKTLQTQINQDIAGNIQLQGFGGEAKPWFQFYGPTINFNIGDTFRVLDNIKWNSKTVLTKNALYEVKYLSSLREHIFQLVKVDSNGTVIGQIDDYDVIFGTANGSITDRPDKYHIIHDSPDISIRIITNKVNIKRDIHSIINNISISIGGQTIDKHYGEWFDIYNQLFENNIDYLNSMTMTNPIVGSYSTLYIPLRFWFNRNAGLALPLIALQYHEVKVHFNFNSTINSAI